MGIFALADDNFQLIDIAAQLEDNGMLFGVEPAANSKIIVPPDCAK